MNKTAIKNFAVWARNKLIDDITYKAGLIGVSEKGIAQPLPQSSKDLQFFDVGTKDYAQVAGKEIEQRNALVRAIQEKERASDYQTALKSVVEEVAYTWFNRLIAIRFMEVNDYLPSRIRVLSSENPAKNEPDFVTTPFDTDMEFTMAEQDKIMQLKDENKLDALFRMLFIKQCNKLHEILPELFEKTNDYTELLLSITFTDRDGVVYHLVHDIDESYFDITTQGEDGKTPGQVEIIGWMYQYYNTEPKDETFTLLKKSVKITKDRIPAATQLFTPDWIVRYMVENSLGRLWKDSHPDCDFGDKWIYYIEPTEENEPDQIQLNQLRLKNGLLNIEEIKIIDPCMGSGHILVYCFDMLMQIYESQGYTPRDAVQSILESNLYGLDIDKRAVQLAYFAVMMKARQYDRRIFTRAITPHMYTIEESNGINRNQLKFFGAGLSPIEKNKAKLQINGLLDSLEDAKEYGSILKIEKYDWELLRQYCHSIDDSGQMTLETIGIEHTQQQLKGLIKTAETMALKYHVVVTNPPYMGNKGFTEKLLKYITKYYPEGKIDLYAVFIEKCSEMTLPCGVYSMVTPESWMFLSRFEKLRRPFLEENTIQSMLHLGFGAFDSGFGTVAFSAVKGNFHKLKAACYRLVDYPTAGQKEKAIFTTTPFYSNKDAYYLVDGVPICYWVSQAMLDNFNEPKVKDNGKTCVGLLTGNNELFLRYWYEVSYDLMGIGYTHEQAQADTTKKWFPINQYGEYRKWFGNNMIVFDWWNDGFNIKKFKMDRYLAGEAEKKNSMCWNEDTYFCPGITWNRISTSKFSARLSPLGNTAGSSSPIYFPLRRQYYLLALFNSCVFSEIVQFLNPTVSFQTADIEKVPVIFDTEEVDELAKENVSLAEDDWNSFETSYGFKKHPLI